MKKLYLGLGGSGKTTLAREYYLNKVMSTRGAPKTLVLVASRFEKFNWSNQLDTKILIDPQIHSYFAFIKRELTLFWPLILEQTTLIEAKNPIPIYMNYETSQSLMGKLIHFFRRKDYLINYIASDEEIAKKLLSDIVSAGFGNINYKKIGERIRYGLKDNKVFGDNFYEEINEIIESYISRTLTNGVIDQGVAIYLYNNYLLTDPLYLENLESRFDNLIVDDFELAPTSLIDFVGATEGIFKEINIFRNPLRGYGSYQFSGKYITDFTESRGFEKIILKNSLPLTSLDFLKSLYIFLDKESFFSLETFLDKKQTYHPLYFNLDFEYKFEGDTFIFNELKKLIQKGINPNDISIITPTYDVTLDFGLKRIAKEFDFEYLYTSKNESLIDDIYVFSLVSFAILYYEYQSLKLNTDELKIFLKTTLNTTYIRANFICDYLKNHNYKIVAIEASALPMLPSKLMSSYNKLVHFKDNLEKELPIYHLFQKVFLEFFSDFELERESSDNISLLIDSAGNFYKTISLFKTILSPNAEFITLLRSKVKSNESLEEVKDKAQNDFLALSTPSSYLALKRRSKYIFISDIHSNYYTLEGVNELQNLWSINKCWDGIPLERDRVEEFRRKDFLNIITRLASTSENIYFIGSYISSRGYTYSSVLEYFHYETNDSE